MPLDPSTSPMRPFPRFVSMRRTLAVAVSSALLLVVPGCCRVLHLGWSSGWVSASDYVLAKRAPADARTKAEAGTGDLDRRYCRSACHDPDLSGEVKSCRYRAGRPAAEPPIEPPQMICNCRYGDVQGTVPAPEVVATLPRGEPLAGATCSEACGGVDCQRPEPTCWLTPQPAPPPPAEGEEAIECTYHVRGHCGSPHLT